MRYQLQAQLVSAEATLPLFAQLQTLGLSRATY
jgi:hypothetical protein